MELFLLIISTTFKSRGRFAVGGGERLATFLTLKLSSSLPKRSEGMGHRLRLLRLHVIGQRQEVGKQPRLLRGQRQPGSMCAHVP